MELKKFKKQRSSFVLNPQPGNMYRTPWRWDTIMELGMNPQCKENTYGWIILKALENGPRTYTQLMQAIEAELFTNPIQWEKYYKRMLARSKAYIKLAETNNDTGPENDYYVLMQEKVEYIKKLLETPTELLPRPWDDAVWEFYMPAMNPGFSQLLAVMEAQGRIKRIKRGIYSL